MNYYTLTCGPLVVDLCGEHIHQGLLEVEHLPADDRVTHQAGKNCKICERESDAAPV